MTIWKEFEGWTYEYFDRDIEPAALPGYEGRPVACGATRSNPRPPRSS